MDPQLIGLAKFTVACAFLLLASAYDIRTREVPNWIWLVFTPIAIGLTMFELAASGWSLALAIILAVSIGVSVGIFFATFYLGLFGGADAKALIALAVLYPLPPSIVQPLLGYPLVVFPVTILASSVIASLVVIPASAIRNTWWTLRSHQPFFEGLSHESRLRKAVAYVFCMKKESRRLKDYDILAEDFAEGSDDPQRRLVFFRRLTEEEYPRPSNLPPFVFITFPIPMILFILVGFLVAIFVGDIAMSAVSWLLSSVL